LCSIGSVVAFCRLGGTNVFVERLWRSVKYEEVYLRALYQPETDDLENAKRGLRIALTKNSVTFYRIDGGPNGSSYGLLEWYDKAKPQTPENEKKPKRKRGRPRKSEQKRRGRPPKAKAAGNVVGLARQPEKQTATPEKEAAAAAELRTPRGPEKRGGEPKTPRRKEEPDVAHQPDVSGPVKAAEAA